jgi:REP element-mobilizing transposase RayT
VSRQLGFSVWQRDYYEHIIRDERAYDNISNYINDNPLKWDNDKFILPTQKFNST